MKDFSTVLKNLSSARKMIARERKCIATPLKLISTAAIQHITKGFESAARRQERRRVDAQRDGRSGAESQTAAAAQPSART